MLKRGQVTEKTNMTLTLERPTSIEPFGPQNTPEDTFTSADANELGHLYNTAYDIATSDDRLENTDNLRLSPRQVFEMLREVNDDIASSYAGLIVKGKLYTDETDKKFYEDFVHRKDIAEKEAEREQEEAIRLGREALEQHWGEEDATILGMFKDEDSQEEDQGATVIHGNFSNHRAA